MAYVCQQCGAISHRWKGRCDACSAWDSLLQEAVRQDNDKTIDKLTGKPLSSPLDAGQQSAVVGGFESLSAEDTQDFPRLATGMAEFDRVCGGGLVAGSVSLVAGDPGIGKSTLLLQLAAMMAQHTCVMYISGEESSGQIRLRARRLGLHEAGVHLMSTQYLDTVLSEIPKVLAAHKNQKSLINVSTSESNTKQQAPYALDPNLSRKQDILPHTTQRQDEQNPQERTWHSRQETKKEPVTDDVLTPLKNKILPGFMIVDSIQTMVIREMSAAAGSLGQIREVMSALITLAKSTGLAVMIVGHITKDGAIAGPKLLEHMVDTVLYFEGENNRPYRLLRTIKNRFGATHEVGVFDMTEKGLRQVTNPSSLFLSARQTQIAGASIFAGMEGTRPLLIEFQALSTTSFLASPRRSVVGWDANRLSMILAVLEARCQMPFSKKDVFLTVLGGIRVHEPAADLCVALALLSCLKKTPLPAHAVAFGEIGLTGEVYPTSFTDHRVREAEQLGFKHVFTPQSACTTTNLHHVRINHVQDLVGWFRTQKG